MPPTEAPRRVKIRFPDRTIKPDDYGFWHASAQRLFAEAVASFGPDIRLILDDEDVTDHYQPYPHWGAPYHAKALR